MCTPKNKISTPLTCWHAIINKLSKAVLFLLIFCLIQHFNTAAQDSIPASIPNYISLNALGAPVCENFNSLAVSGTSSVLPSGWYIYEKGAGADQLYTAGDGSSSRGDTYSLGATGSNDRAIGSHISGNLSSAWGLKLYNNTGATLNGLKISFTGETWRVGAARRLDRIDFQYSITATSLSSTSGWINVGELDYVNEGKPRRGEGKLLHSDNLSFTLEKIVIPNNSFFWLKWTDADIQGRDDGMGIDDFCITPVFLCTGEGPSGIWTGAIDDDWFNCANWANGIVPGPLTDVTISANARPPVISGEEAIVRNITFNSGAKLFMPNSISKLTVFGNFINNSGYDLDGTVDTGSTVIFKGDTAQLIGGNDITTFQRLVIKNNIAAVSLNQNINVVNQLLLKQDADLSLGDFDLTLKSFSSITAGVGIIPEKAKINYNGKGRCIVERYVNTGVGFGQHGKSWQFLATPVLLEDGDNQTIKQSWQEGAETAVSTSNIENLKPGYGTLITTNLGGNDAAARELGFDVYTRPGPSIKSWNGLTQSWEGPTSTNIPVTNDKGYMIFVRGDRSVITYDADATTTTMRVRGKLHQPGINAPKRMDFFNEGFHSVGNPFASAIDFSNLNKTDGISNSFYVFDPTLKGTYGVGGYQTIVGALGYIPTPGSIRDTSTLYITGKDYRNIQSGQAFFIYSLDNTLQSITFKETDKVTGSRLASKTLNRTISMLNTNLFAMVHGQPILADGNRVVFDNQYSNKVDGYDALKMKNGGENFGILRDGCLLAVEARQEINNADTIFYWMSGLKEMDYSLMFVPADLSDKPFNAYLLDEYLHTRVPVSMNDTVRIPFKVTGDIDSRSEQRFKLVFSEAGPVPVEIVDITAIRNEDNHVVVSWNIGYELNVDVYDLERSANGRDFEKIHSQRPISNNGTGAFYSYVDECPLQGVSFYRVKAMADFGRVSYSNIVRVEDKVFGPSISVYPIPVGEGNLQVSLQNQQPGKFEIRMMNAFGQVLLRQTWQLFTGNNTRFIQIDKRFSPGNYFLELISSEGKKQVVKVVVN